jgi:glycerophosphoryl diester phosphodiesterase
MNRFVAVAGTALLLWLALFSATLLIEHTHSNLKPSGLPGFLSHDRMMIMAHRGSRYLVAENTLEGHECAAKFDVDVLETDVRITSDQQIVLHHDVNTIRTTGQSNLVHELSLGTPKREM